MLDSAVVSACGALRFLRAQAVKASATRSRTESKDFILAIKSAPSVPSILDSRRAEGFFCPLASPRPGAYICGACLTRFQRNYPPRPTNSHTCGGFFDVPGAQKRLGEINALMAADNFWNNREQAQKLIDEANALRNKTEPLLKAEKQLEDFQVMVELGEAEPEAAQEKIQQELERDVGKFFKELDSLELKVFLNGPHDRSNCIMSINAGAGGTESCDWANMLLRMYQRWAESRGWEVEVTDVLVGEAAGIKSATLVFTGENAYGFADRKSVV